MAASRSIPLAGMKRTMADRNCRTRTADPNWTRATGSGVSDLRLTIDDLRAPGGTRAGVIDAEGYVYSLAGGASVLASRNCRIECRLVSSLTPGLAQHRGNKCSPVRGEIFVEPTSRCLPSFRQERHLPLRGTSAFSVLRFLAGRPADKAVEFRRNPCEYAPARKS